MKRNHFFLLLIFSSAVLFFSACNESINDSVSSLQSSNTAAKLSKEQISNQVMNSMRRNGQIEYCDFLEVNDTTAHRGNDDHGDNHGDDSTSHHGDDSSGHHGSDYKWDVKFVTINGAVVKFEYKSDGTLKEIQGLTGPFNYELDPENGAVVYSEARSNALAAKDGNIVYWKLKREGDGWEYRFLITNYNQEYEIRIDGTTGKVTRVKN